MTTLIIILTLSTLLTGVMSAFYWYKSSKVMVMPMEEMNGELQPLPIETNQTEWLRAVYLGIQKTGSLNKKASIYTASAVSLSVISTLVNIVFSNAT